jgi:hypothetical protein
MKGKLENKNFVVLGVLLGFSFVCAGCTTVTSISEAGVTFSQPVLTEDIVSGQFKVGSFTYTVGDNYIARPDGYLIRDRTFMQKNHEAYHEEQKVNSDGTLSVNNEGKPVMEYILNSDYRVASDDEIHLWAHRVAAENAEIRACQ